jgi:ArsR family transcriptional regulator
MTRDEIDPPARRLWALVKDQVGPTPAALQDERRLKAALAARRTKSREFFSSSAGQWDRLRDEMFGERFHVSALAAFLPSDWVVGDLGCGTGPTAAAIVPFVARVVCVDDSAAMLQAARKRLQGFNNVDLRRGELEALPIDDALLDAATLMLVLHHVPEPDRAMAEVARVLKPGGRLIVVDMQPYDRENYNLVKMGLVKDYEEQMGHVWLGFPDEHVSRVFAAAGFEKTRIVPLAPDPRAKGPGLFVATGEKRS